MTLSYNYDYLSGWIINNWDLKLLYNNLLKSRFAQLDQNIKYEYYTNEIITLLFANEFEHSIENRTIIFDNLNERGEFSLDS